MGRIRYTHCPLCSYKHKDREEVAKHIKNEHSGYLEDKGYTAKEVLYRDRNSDNDNLGQCIVCDREVDWNKEKEKYPRHCGSQSCKDHLHNQHVKNTKEKYGIKYRMRDPEYQRRLLEEHKNAKEYKWNSTDDTFVVIGNVEYETLRNLDIQTRVKPDDIHAPAPFHIDYETPNGKKKKHFPDIFIESLNLIISCKDGLDNPNTHPGVKEDRLKNICEYRSILNNYEYNYVQIEGKKEASNISNIIKSVKQNVNRGSRYVVPPRIDFVLHGESPGADISMTAYYVLVQTNEDDEPEALFLSRDIIADENIFHMDGENLVIIDKEKILDDENNKKYYVADLNTIDEEIDLLGVYNNIDLFQNKSMVDIVAYELGIPTDLDISESLRLIMEKLETGFIKRHQEFVSIYENLLDDFDFDDRIKVEDGEIIINEGG